jgi:hypothetical protein
MLTESSIEIEGLDVGSIPFLYAFEKYSSSY